MTEHEKIAKARRQLIMVGVACVTLVVFAFWLITLPATFSRNREKFAPTTFTFTQLKELWKK